MSVQLHRALDIVELLEAAGRGMSLGTIAERTGVGKPAAHRLLQVLVERGYVEQDAETQAYRATLRLAIVGFGHLAATGMRELTYPELHRLAAETGELVRLAVAEDDTLTWIVEAQGAAPGLRYDGNLGRQAVLHATAAGKAWLSTMSDDEAVGRVLKAGFPDGEEVGPNAVTTIDALLATLRETRARGFSTALEEAAVGVNALAVPVHEPGNDGPAVAAVIVVGPGARMTEAGMADMLPAVRAAATRIGDLWPVRRYTTRSS